MIGRLLAWPFKLCAVVFMFLASLCDGDEDESVYDYIKRSLQ